MQSAPNTIRFIEASVARSSQTHRHIRNSLQVRVSIQKIEFLSETLEVKYFRTNQVSPLGQDPQIIDVVDWITLQVQGMSARLMSVFELVSSRSVGMFSFSESCMYVCFIALLVERCSAFIRRWLLPSVKAFFFNHYNFVVFKVILFFYLFDWILVLHGSHIVNLIEKQ